MTIQQDCLCEMVLPLEKLNVKSVVARFKFWRQVERADVLGIEKADRA